MKNLLRTLIWLYIALLIFEGALRKWVFPQLAEPLLISRDPVLLAIYAVALGKGLFPRNGFILALAVMAATAAVLSILAGQTNLIITAYGLRTNFLHFPLIWVMSQTMERRDVDHIGIVLLLLAIPMTVLMVIQFRAPMDAYINRGVGTIEGEVGQIFGADGRIRPPGFFAFVTGPQMFYPLVAAFLFNQLSTVQRRLPWPILLCVAAAIAIALPVSISRTVMLATGVVGVVFLLTLPFSASKASALFRPLLILAVLALFLSRLPVFKESVDVFMIRWVDAAAATDGDPWADVFYRTVQTYINPMYFAAEAPFFGHGIGMASNVASRLLYGVGGINLAEEEWGKNILEMGPVLGFAYIGFRFALVFYLARKSINVLRQNRDPLPLLILSACGLAITQSQLGPPTLLGFVVVGPGLLLAALNTRTASITPTSNEQKIRMTRGSRPNLPVRGPRPSDRRLPPGSRHK